MTAFIPRQTDPPAAESRALVDRIQAGDPDAFADLYRQYHDVVFRFVQYRVGNRQLTEDITHDVFTRALRRIGDWTWQGKDVGAWLVTIARNRVADHFKSHYHRRTWLAGGELEVGDQGDDAYNGLSGGWFVDRSREGDPEGTAVGERAAAAIRAALAGLTEDQRTCVTLRFFDGLSVAQTAAAMGRNEAAVKSVQVRAIRALRQTEAVWAWR